MKGGNGLHLAKPNEHGGAEEMTLGSVSVTCFKTLVFRTRESSAFDGLNSICYASPRGQVFQTG
jgi:hypothetical protein